MDQQNPDVLLEELLTGQDRLLTSGEVADILNVNANTLYLWRTSPEVNLPFQRFVAPGQTRGMIRYRYSDVARFIAEARERGDADRVIQAETGTQRLTLTVEASDEEELAEYTARLERNKAASARHRQQANKRKKERLREIPFDEAVKFSPTFVEEKASSLDDKAREFLESLGISKE